MKTNPVDENITILAPLNIRIVSMVEQTAVIVFSDPNYDPLYPNNRVDFMVERSSDGVFTVLPGPAITKQDTLVTVIDSMQFVIGVTYSYRITAVKGNVRSTVSASQYWGFTFSAPANLTFELPNETTAHLTWTNTNSMATKVLIERSVNGTAYQLVDSVAVNVTSKDVSGLYSSDTTYFFRIKNVSILNQSDYSTPVSQKLYFAAPGALSVLISDETTAKLTWTNPNSLATKVMIEKSTNAGGTYQVVDSVAANVTSKDVSGVYSSDTTYTFRIKNVATLNQSTYTTPVSQTLFFPSPSNFTIMTMSMKGATFSWTDNSSFENNFEIEQSTDNVPFLLIKSVPRNNTTVSVNSSFDSATTYYFRVRAKSAYNVSGYSAVLRYNIAIAEADSAAATAGGYQVLVKGGTYSMGSPSGVGFSNEYPQHSVTLSSFYIGQKEVTRKLWREVVQWKQGSATSPLNPNPSYFMSNDTLPVEQVSWDDIQIWLGYLNEKAGLTSSTKKYRLPTEAEWEYAARGGVYWTKNYLYSGSNAIDGVAWYFYNSLSTTHPVSTKSSNQLNIFDMSGNVFEWCEDWYHTSYTGAPSDGSSWSSQQSGNPYRVLRGGSWTYFDFDCRVANRYSDVPSIRNVNIGFRLSRTP